jgi:hypothetical protein
MAIPAVAYDLSPGGLSADGGTLVLFRQSYAYPLRRSTFAVLATERLRVRQWVRIRGAYTFDALSPDGRIMYLIHYLRPGRDPSRYEVRAFDLGKGELLRKPIVDPEEPDEQMAGLPITRATSPDGRWAYTLYDGNGGEPFIHALDTVGRTAVCIDLPQLEGRRNPFLLELDVDAGTGDLTILTRSPKNWVKTRTPLLAVDTESFEVSDPEASSTATDDRNGDTGPAWVLIGAALAGFALAIVAGAGLTRGGRRARPGNRLEQELPADPEVREPATRK